MKSTLVFFLSILSLHANPDLFRENFADPATRTAAISTLTPGTRDHFFFTALDHQLRGRSEEYANTIAAWKAAAATKNPVSTEGMNTLEARRVLTDYDRDPQKALSEMIREMDLEFDDTRPDSTAEEMALPTSLDADLITGQAFRKKAEQAEPRSPYELYSQEMLYKELDGLDSFSDEKIRWFINAFKHTHHPKYVTLLAKGMSLQQPIPVADTDFKPLTLAQMNELLKAVPATLRSPHFNASYIEKLKPTSPKDLERDLKVHAAFLNTCREFTSKLPSSRNDMKAHVLYHHLRLQEKLGNYPKQDFLAYLALPRADHALIRPAKKTDNHLIHSSDLNNITQCLTVSNDNELIESYLSHFLSLSDTLDKDFVLLIQEKYLSTLHARSRILAGADPELHASRLSPAEYKALREEVRIGFTPTAQQLFSSKDEVSLPLDLKNTPNLLIRIYALDEKFSSEHHGATVDLDGLVPHHSRSLSFSQAPAVLHRENIALPELSGAGNWIVEFVSDRISARALVRKGNITPYISRTATGQMVQLFDESAQPVKDFSIHLGEETFVSKDGMVTVPDSVNQPRTNGTVTAGKLSCDIRLGSRTNDLALATEFLLDREQLLANQTTTLHLRNRLTNHGQPLPLDRVKNATLVLNAKLLGNVVTERVIADPLALGETNAIPFLVPADLLSLTITLSGAVTSETSGESITLTQSETYNLNHSLLTTRIATVFFSYTTDGHQLELRGRNGEPLPNRPVSLSFTHKHFSSPIVVRLRTDDAGRIALGKLDGIETFTASSSSIVDTTFSPPNRKLEVPETYIIPADQNLRIPLTQDKMRTLIRLPDNTPIPYEVTADAHLSVALAPGSYRLSQGESKTNITVFPSDSVRGNLLVTANEIVPIVNPATPTVAETTMKQENLRIRIANASPETRVTVIAKRYEVPGWIPGSAAYPFEPDSSPLITRPIRPSSYLTDRHLSDEMRYIIDRRAAKIFPGSMLPRPGQLLYPWTPEELDQADQNERYGTEGDENSSMSTGGGGGSVSKMRLRKNSTARSHTTTLDFLSFPAAVEFSLTPDAKGNIEIPLARMQGAQFVEIIAADTVAADTVFFPLPSIDTPLRDRRLARPLPAESHHIATRSAAALAPGAEVEIRNLLDADWRAFTTLAEAHQFLLGTTGSDELREFSFLTKWPTLDEKQKLALLSDHHCHELHLFLARKDKPFFEKHVKPFLTAKTEPKFIDDYLLTRDLKKYLRPYAFSRLNAAEKALLAQALPASQKAIVNELNLRWQLEAPSPDAETVLFSQTLKGSDLSDTDSLGLASNTNGTDRLLYQAAGYFDLGKYDAAKTTYENILRVDPYNQAARRGIEKIAATKSDYYRAAYDNTRAELLSQVDKAWDLSVGSDFSNPVDGSSISGLPTAGLRSGDYAVTRNSIDAILNNPNRSAMPSDGNAELTNKLRNIIIPRIDFENTTVEEAIAFLRLRAAELDSAEPDPLKKGMNFVVRRGADVGSTRIDELSLKNVPMGVALKYICDKAKLRYSVDDFAVTLSPLTETGDDLYTRTFQVPPDFVATLSDSQKSEDDPFAAAGSSGNTAGLKSRPAIAELLKQNGINLPAGASATLGRNGQLLVTAPASELDKVEQLTEVYLSEAPSNVGNADPFAAGGGIGGLAPAPRLFPNATRLWLEANYYHHPDSITDEELIPLNRFWLELAAWDGKGPFTSPHFNACTDSANDALMCLAMLDLPFTAEKPEVAVDGSTLKVKAVAPMLLFYKDTRETDKIAPESPLLVRQSYHPLSEPFLTVNGKLVENTHTGDFRTGTAYGVSLVITNPTGIERRIETLAQIPAGSIPLATAVSETSSELEGILPALPPLDDSDPIGDDAPATLSTSHNLQPYGVIRLQLAFYFPAAGDYTAYPLHVSENGTVLAHAKPRTLRVSAEPAPEDSASWKVLARDGTPEAVLNRLTTENLATIDLDQMLWRLKDKDFFLKTTKILRERLWMDENVFTYAMLHNDPASLSELFESTDMAENLGSWFTSGLITITPAIHGEWQTQEFDPLVNARAHPFGENPYLTHSAASDHYQAFLDTLGWKPALSAQDELTFTLFLFLQDRVDEALHRFAKIDPAALPDRLQYDYLHAVALFHQEKPDEAKTIAQPYSAKLPPGLWKDRYDAVIAQADEIARPIAAVTTDEKSTAPTLAIFSDSKDTGKIMLKHTNLTEAEIRLYHIDLEILFSKDPFLKGDGESSLPPIAPNLVVKVPIEKASEETAYSLPEEFRKGNILVAAESGSAKQLKILDSQAIEIRTNPADRTVQIIDPASGKSLPKTYIKVYAETTEGTVEFHKDGYTDLRGKFDYLSHTATDSSTIRRLAILVSHPEKGSLTRIINR